jgi:hypothetical protein
MKCNLQVIWPYTTSISSNMWPLQKYVSHPILELFTFFQPHP